MRTTLSVSTLLVCITIALAAFALPLAGRLAAQDTDAALEEPATDDAPDAAMDAPSDEPGLDETDAADKPAARGKPAATDQDEEKGPALSDDPAVQAVLESHPQTPQELLRAIQILADLGHAALAKGFVDELTARKLDAPAKVALADRFNSGVLMRLARHAELAPALSPFIDDLMHAAEAFRRDGARLAQAARQLSDPDQSLRAAAIVALSRARESAVAPLVAILADPKRAAEQTRARQMLVQLGDVAVAPLLGVLDSPDAALNAQVVEVLGRLRAEGATARLLGVFVASADSPALRTEAARALAAIGGRAPNISEALRLLAQGADRALAQSRQQSADGTMVEVWHWNAKAGQSVPVQYDEAGAALANAVRLARDLYRFDPGNAEHRRLYLTAILQAAKLRIGLDKPLPTEKGTAHAMVCAFGPAIVEDVLKQAMAQGYVPAAIGAAEILGDTGDVSLLAPRGAAYSPLAFAAQHADRRLRFAAIGAIMKFKPTAPFAGSSQVANGLAFFASSYGSPRVLVVHPRSDEAQKIAGLASAQGYDGDIATNGRRAFELATRSSDYDFIFIHSAVERPRVDELVAQLRRDSRTAELALGLIAPLEDWDRVERYAYKLPRAAVMLQPQNDAEMKLFIARLLALAGQRHVAAAERKSQAIAALDWLEEICHQPQNFFDVHQQEDTLLQAMFVPELSARATAVLGQLNSTAAQRGLLEVADLASQPPAARRAAATAFATSARKHGILLSRQEVLEQYGLYNANAGRDADTHAVLGTILDAIEHKGDTASSP